MVVKSNCRQKNDLCNYLSIRNTLLVSKKSSTCCRPESHDQVVRAIFLHQCFLTYHTWTLFSSSASCQTKAFGFFSKEIAEAITRIFFTVEVFMQLLRNFFEICGGICNIMRFVDSLVFLLYQNDMSAFTKKSCSNSNKKLFEFRPKLRAQTINFFLPAMKLNR